MAVTLTRLPTAIVLCGCLAGCTAPAAPARPASLPPMPAPDLAMTVPIADWEAEAERLRSLGLRVPDGGVVLERPWDEPFTRRSFVVPQAWFRSPPPGTLVLAEELEKDLPLLEQLMSRAYGGWDTAKARGWDWAAWFSTWRASLAKRHGERLSLEDAFAPVKKLMEFQLDNHTTIPLGRETRFGSGSQSFVVQGWKSETCTEIRAASGNVEPLASTDPAQRIRSAKHWEAKTRTLEPIAYLSVPGNRGDATAIHCGDQWLALQKAWPPRMDIRGHDEGRSKAVLALSGAATDAPDVKLMEPTVAYARFPTFSKENAQVIEQRSSGWPRPTGKERVLIVDLRDNGGGDVALDALSPWLDESDSQRIKIAFDTHRHQGASCLYHALRWGYTTDSSTDLRPPLSKEMIENLQEGMDSLFQAREPGCPRAFDDSNAGWDYRQHKMLPPGPVEGHRRIVVLVNNGTGSDGEFMTMLLATLPQTVVVGSNTYGVAQYIQPGYSVLPHTRLPFRIALGTADNYGDDRSFDGYGFDVDVLLSAEADQSPDNVLSLAKYIGG